MRFSKQYLEKVSRENNFIKDTLEKVMRLKDVLNFINNDTYMKGKLAIKGGTAINLIILKLPRLSVDIDLDLAQNLKKEKLLEEKEKIVNRLIKYMEQNEYKVKEKREYFALSSFTFHYINSSGNNDNIKVEINFLNRCHILPLVLKEIYKIKDEENFDVLTLDTIELYASKINALLSRSTPRDLYDVNTMIEKNIIQDKEVLKKCIIFYSVISGDYDIEKYNYEKIESLNFYKFKTQLKPVISKRDSFDIEKAKSIVIEYLKNILVFTSEEKQFIKNMKSKKYNPELLFKDEEIIKNIIHHPAAIWRCNK